MPVRPTANCKYCEHYQRSVAIIEQAKHPLQPKEEEIKKSVTRLKRKSGKLRILLACLSMRHISGQPMYYLDLALELKKQGHDVTIVSNWDYPKDMKEKPEIKKAVARARIKRFEVKELLFEKYHPEFDLIIASEEESRLAIKKYSDVPVIFVVHSQYECETPVVEPNIFVYVCIRPEIKEHIVKEHGIPAEKCVVIYNGIDLLKFTPIDRPERDYYKVVIPATTDLLREQFLNYFIEKANKDYWVYLFTENFQGVKLPKNEFVFISPSKIDIQNEIADADEVPSIHFGRVTIEAMACNVKATVYDPKTLEFEEAKPPGNFVELFDIRRMTQKLLALYFLPDLTIVIPHHNRHDHLHKLLNDLDEWFGLPIRICQGGTFAENCNCGGLNAKTEWVIFVNDDIRILDKNIFRDMLLAGADIVGCNLRPSVNGFYFKDNKLEMCFYGDGKKPVYPGGAFMMVRTKVFKELGGFDEIYKTGAEDVDFVLRAEKAGYKMSIVPNVIEHLELQSEGRFDNLNHNILTFNERWKPRHL